MRKNIPNMMEDEKFIRKKTLNSNSLLTVAENYINTAKKFSNQNKYDEAINEYNRAARIYMELDYYRELGICNRMIGEIYMWKGDFDEALKYQNIHLAIARQGNDLVEQQRATASLGITYLLQSQSFIDDEKSKQSLTKAENALSVSYSLCERLCSTISSNDVTDMKVRLRINFALLEEFLGNFGKAIEHLDEAIEASSSKKMYEMLLNCYMIKSKLYDDKWKDYSEALECLNNAIIVAQKLADKDIKICQVLVAMATVCCKMACYDRALALLLDAEKLNTPDKEKIKTNINVVTEMTKILQQLNLTNSDAYVTLKGYYEKLGDSACELLDFISAEKFYLYMLNCAAKAGLNGMELTPCYISLGQTYKDMGCYDKALHYYFKEYELMKDDPKEAYETLSVIAELLYLDKKPYAEIEEYCNKARKAAQKCDKKKSRDCEVTILKDLLKYQQKYGIVNEMEYTKLQLKDLGCDISNLEHVENYESSVWGNAVCTMDNLTAGILKGPSKSEYTSTSYAVKRNGLGETQLHLACKSGKTDKVQKLISEGHPIDIRDNAGWLPLHEACLKGHTDIVKILIDNGADVNDKGGKECQGTTPLIDAARNGHLEVVEILLDKGASPSLQSDIGVTPLEILKNWRQNNNVLPDREILYKNVCNKMKPSDCQGNENFNLPETSEHVSEDITIQASPVTPLILSKESTQLLELREKLLFDYRYILSSEGDRKVTKSKQPLSIKKRKMSDISGQKRTKTTKRMSLDNNNGNSKDESQYITNSSDVREPLKDLLGCNERFACTRGNDHKVLIRKFPKSSSNKINTESGISDIDAEQQIRKEDGQQWNQPGPSCKPHITPPEDQNLVNVTTTPIIPRASLKDYNNGGVDNISAESGLSNPKVRRSSKSERSAHLFAENEADINSPILQSEERTVENGGDCNGIGAHPAQSDHQTSNEPSSSKQAEWTIIGYKIVDSLKGIENILDRIANRYCT